VVLVVEQSEYEVGEIVSFSRGSGVATHRIHGFKQEDGVRKIETKGDANSVSDSFLLSEEMVIGRVEAVIKYVGFVLLYLQSKYFIYSLLLVSVAWLLKKDKDEK